LQETHHLKSAEYYFLQAATSAVQFINTTSCSLTKMNLKLTQASQSFEKKVFEMERVVNALPA